MCDSGATSIQCGKSFDDYMTNQWRSSSFQGLANYIHAYQDAFSPSHYGFKQIHIDVDGIGLVGGLHIAQDSIISTTTHKGITKGTENLIKNYWKNCKDCK